MACHSVERAGIAAQGFDADRLCQVLRDFQAGEANLHGLVIQRHGELVAERYRSGKDRSVYSLFARSVDFDAHTRHDLRSVSKSVTSLLWGIAQAEHKTPPLDARVLDLFPELAELRRDGREAITVGHLLSMSSGLEWKEPYQYGLGNDELALYWRASQEKAVLSRPMLHPPGARFQYSGGATAVLARLLERGVGMPLPEYARTRLFAPLGITDWEWMQDLRGRPLAFAGLRMRPRDLARIGQLVLQRGEWNGRQLVPAAWIDDALRPHAEIGDGRQYGYQWWLGATPPLGGEQRWAAAYGNGGQRLFVAPGLDLVVVITAGMYNEDAGVAKVNRMFQQIAAAVDR
ncbi:serine hydrolase [Massilia sp. ST3]|uniref:serine hydrolase domain-containing protein n=1 Tax=Massilia sp. ST3 TaxID=2824903 RepID=UPI001B81A7F3|nr:serine hydrolase [Massilia sp. ST3]MBQ5945922.1 serine hydrolase [Massilia sp. ST3]